MLTPVASAAGRFIVCKRSFCGGQHEDPRADEADTDGTGQIHPLPGKQAAASATSAGEEPRATG